MKNIILITCLFFWSFQVHAFKLDTHLWVGQQVINDFEDDGKISIKLDGNIVNIDVPADVKNAILFNKSAYLMGNIGPDAVPDVVVGQTVVHPGVKNSSGVNSGWQTNDWLQYLLRVSKDNSVAKPFTYGYLAHAAADVFAHTYVNQYSGDIFNLSDETLVEQRHIILENYIASHTPPLVNYLGQPLGNSWDQISLSTGYTNFVRDKLVYDSSVQAEYKKVPTALHLVAYTEYRNSIDNLAESAVWHDIDVAVAQYVAAYYDVDLTYAQASKIVNAAQPVIDKLNVEVPDKVQEATNGLYDITKKFDATVFGNVAKATTDMQKAENAWFTKHQEWRRKLLDVQTLPSCPKVPETDCNWFGCWPTGSWVDEPGCAATKRIIQDSNNLVLKAAETLENAVNQKKSDLINSTIKLKTEAVKAADSVHHVHNSLIDLAQVFSADVSPIQSFLRAWRGDVDVAMGAYVKATSQSMINTMNPNASAIEPITTWFDCYHMSIIGISSTVSNCELKNSILSLKNSVDQTLLLIDEATSMGSTVGLPSPVQLHELKERLIDELVNKLKERVATEVVKILPAEERELLELLDKGADDQSLKLYFTKAETASPAKGLIMIPDIAERVKAEMHLTPSGAFDPEKYAVAYNAVVLAKLALLDKFGFQKLAIAAGSTDYIAYFDNMENLVAPAFASIDGNHQWMPIPPHPPNSLNVYPAVNYTYSSDRSGLGETGGLGFVLWKGDMRNRLFRKIFIGPVSPGIDFPVAINKQRIVSSIYPYQPCAVYPFPSAVSDKTCTAITIMPVLDILLN